MGDSAHTTHHTNPGEKPAPPLGLFVKDENIFSKIAIKVKPRVPNLEKCSNLGEKEGVADDFENDPSFRSKPTVPVIPLERF